MDSTLRRAAPAALLVLAACGGRDLPIDPEGVARYGAYSYDENAPQPSLGGGGQALDLSGVDPAQPAGGSGGEGAVVASATPAGGAPQQGGGRAKKGAKYEVITVEKGGTIKVTVKLTKAPEAQTLTLNKDKKGCGGHETRPVDRVVYDPTSLTLANAVVYLVDVTKGKDFEGDLANAERDVILDQKDCNYVPHVMLVKPGAKVRVKNSDPVQHNAKGFYNNKATLKFNVMSSSNSLLPPSDDTTLEKAGNYILNCDIHLWMTGYIRAIPHPYYGVTGTDGTVTLTNVPPGEYKVGCWHEGMLLKVEQTGAEITGYKYSEDFELPAQTVTVAPEGTAEVAFTTDPR
jgi:plastocyanin